MTVVLETQRVFGKIIVAALVQNVIDEHHSPNYLAVTGERHPLAVLIRTGEQIVAFTPQGDPMTVGQIHQLKPDAVAQLMTKEMGS